MCNFILSTDLIYGNLTKLSYEYSQFFYTIAFACMPRWGKGWSALPQRKFSLGFFIYKMGLKKCLLYKIVMRIK